MNDTEISVTVAGFLVAVGWFLKNQTPLRNEWIPSIVMVAGLAATLLWTHDFTVAGVIQAFMSGATAIGFHAGTTSTIDAVKTGKATE